MPDTTPSKSQLRATLRSRRQTLGPVEQVRAAHCAAESVFQLSQWNRAGRVAFYLAADGELDPTPLAARARSLNKQVFLPVIQADNSLLFAAWDSADQLIDNRYGIPEPPPQAQRCPVQELDILFLPLVGWDRLGGRLGMGGGFYDRTLAQSLPPLLIGLAHSCQEVARVPREEWDIPLDFIVTDTALHRCQGAK